MFHNPSSFTKLGQKHLFHHCTTHHGRVSFVSFLFPSMPHKKEEHVIDKRYAMFITINCINIQLPSVKNITEM